MTPREWLGQFVGLLIGATIALVWLMLESTSTVLVSPEVRYALGAVVASFLATTWVVPPSKARSQISVPCQPVVIQVEAVRDAENGQLEHRHRSTQVRGSENHRELEGEQKALP